MNIMNHLDQIQLLKHISDAATVHRAAAEMAANLPKTATATHYGPDGSSVASYSTTSYDNVDVNGQGEIIGGSLQNDLTDKEKKPLSHSEVNFQENGTPGAIRTSINNRFADQGRIFKTVDTDLTGVEWNEASNIISGDVLVNTQSTDGSIPNTDGRLTYADEVPTSGHFTHYISQSGKLLRGYTHVDYTTANFRGSRITGGYYTVESQDTAGRKQAASNLFFSAESRIQEIHTTNFDPETGESKGRVFADFSDMVFDSLNQFDSGSVSYRVTDEKGNQTAGTTAHFDAGVPTRTEIRQFSKGRVTHQITTDYSKSKFNNDLSPINSTSQTQVENAAGKLCSTTETTHDGDGNPVKNLTTAYDIKTGEAYSTVETENSNVVFDHHRKPIGGSATITATLANGGGQTVTTKNYGVPSVGKTTPSPSSTSSTPADKGKSHSITTQVKNAAGEVIQIKATTMRPEGTVLKVIITSLENKKPMNTSIALYATDGQKVLKKYELDLHDADFDEDLNVISGSIAMTGKFAGSVLESESTLTY